MSFLRFTHGSPLRAKFVVSVPAREAVMSGPYDLNAPAEVVHHLGHGTSEGGVCYPTLRQAIECAQVEIEQMRPWIITRDGNILSPHKVALLKNELLAGLRPRAGRL